MTTHLFGFPEWSFQYSHSIGRNEYSGTGLRFPMDVALGTEDMVYVLNRSYPGRPEGIRITKVTIDEQYVTEFGSAGEGSGQFIWPIAIALDSQENVYVADEWLDRITVFTKDGETVRTWGKTGSGPGEMDRPAGLAISSDGVVYVSDSRNHRIQKFTPDGKYLGHFGSFGRGSGQLYMPWGLALDQDRQVYAADWRNDRIQKFGSDGEWQGGFGTSGSGVGEFDRPTGVCVDQDGLVYVADWRNDRVQILNRDGRFVTELLGDHQLSPWGKAKLASNPEMVKQRAMAYVRDPVFERKLRRPCAVKVDKQGNIVVSDHSNGRLQVYAKRSAPVLV